MIAGIPIAKLLGWRYRVGAVVVSVVGGALLAWGIDRLVHWGLRLAGAAGLVLFLGCGGSAFTAGAIDPLDDGGPDVAQLDASDAQPGDSATTATDSGPGIPDAAPDAPTLDAGLDAALDAPLDAAPVVLASGQSDPRGIALDATRVYWADQGSGVVASVSKSGGAVFTIATGPSAAAVAVDATSVYWTTYVAAGAVMMAPKGGGAAVTLVSGQNLPSSIAVDPVSVYWTTPTPGAVLQMPIAGGAVVTVGTCGDPYVTVQGSTVAWACFDGHVEAAPVGGGAVTTLASSQASPSALALYAGRVYWTDFGTGPAGSLWACDLASCSPSPLYGGAGNPAGLAVDATGVYWGSNAGPVMHAGLDGSGVSQIAPGQDPFAFALDSSALYWADLTAGTINRLAH